jgi:hypothetical protein
MRDELLNKNSFGLDHAPHQDRAWADDYNSQRPHTDRALAQMAENRESSNQAACRVTGETRVGSIIVFDDFKDADFDSPHDGPQHFGSPHWI